ncbi:MAG: hypothetical protein RRZ24_03395 [Clostridia bacterium]
MKVFRFPERRKMVLIMGDKNPKKMPKQKKSAMKPSATPPVQAEPELVKKAKKPV